MTRAVAVLTCVLCATMAGSLFAQGRTGESGYSDQQSWQDQQSWSSRDQDRGTGMQSQQYRGYRDQDTGMRSQQQYGGQQQYGRGMQDQQYWGYRDEMDTGMRGQQQYGRGTDQQYWDMRDRQQMDRGMGMRGQRQMGGAQARLMVIGQVVNENAEVPGVNPDHQVAQIRTREGTTLFVDLGPKDQVQDLNLTQNQSIFVQGQLANISGQRVVMARQIGMVSQLTQINRPQQEGFPGQQRPTGDIYGFQDSTGRIQKQPGQSGQSSQFRSQQRQSDQSGSFSGQPGSSGQSGSSAQSTDHSGHTNK